MLSFLDTFFNNFFPCKFHMKLIPGGKLEGLASAVMLDKPLDLFVPHLDPGFYALFFMLFL